MLYIFIYIRLSLLFKTPEKNTVHNFFFKLSLTEAYNPQGRREKIVTKNEEISF